MAPVPYPSNLGFGRVVGRFGHTTNDTAGWEPEVALSVTFTPMIKAFTMDNPTPGPPIALGFRPVVATIDDQGYLTGPDGETGVDLIATNDPDTDPTGFTYQVTFRIGGASSAFQDFPIVVLEGTTIDLGTVMPAESTAGLTLPAALTAQAVTIEARDAAIQARDAALAALAATKPNVQVFKVVGTFSWTPPVGYKTARVYIIGAGTGGGAGRQGAAGTARFGGGAGAGGGYSFGEFAATTLGTNPITVTIPAGGLGAPGQTAPDSNGANGGQVLTHTSFGTFLMARTSNPVVNGGTAAAGTGAPAGMGAASGSVGGSSSVTATAGTGGTVGSGGPSFGAPGGGAGGGISAANVAFAGGGGGYSLDYLVNIAGGTGGAATGANGTNGPNRGFSSDSAHVSNGGGGGGASLTGNAGSGGTGGVYGGGGGGGGASVNGFSSGAGGNGCSGIVVVIAV